MTRVTVVVPAYNEEELLPACLDALARQDYAGELEVVVVDNASTDGTAAVARRAGVTVVEELRRGYSLALARGFAVATGDIVATTDADTIVPPDWVSRLMRVYKENPDVVSVGGEIVFCNPDRWARLLTRGLLPLLNRLDRRNPAGAHLWGANFSVRRSTFVEAGGWHPDFNLQADTELSERLRRYGRVVLLEDIAVYTSSRRWNRSLVRSGFLYASNLLWFLLFQRPLWHGFPDIRESQRRKVFSWSAARVGALAALFTMLISFVGYEIFAPWSNAFGRTYWMGDRHRKLVALTFDDGPSDPYTARVLDILRAEGVKGTFFLIGENVRRYPAIARRIAREGHAIGNHSDTHPAGFALELPFILQREISRAEATIYAATGVRAHYFRPPQGIRSPWLMRLLEKDSLVAVTWDDAPGDWKKLRAPDLVSFTIARVHPGAIILLHDGLNTDVRADQHATVSALPEIIHRLRRMGYRFATVPELLGASPPLHRS